MRAKLRWICGEGWLKGAYSVGGLLKSKAEEKWESVDPDRPRSSGSETVVAEVGSECESPGGVVMFVWMVCEDFVESFFVLMMALISSLRCLRLSLLLHQFGRLYSHPSPRCLHAEQLGSPSSHFFRLNLQV